ncbi:P-loop containing nucleoside triphosphate hydrolase protein [Cylindrobasidium torrendii FP15055 ss-10]|uniref:p-loop containing nucleoside triphosphate hydrolase protein n=1 Tax=Cylindrobasidium torrendii FP15055 ss-10 TaxID=1314674 RepID=A0A0D7BBV4_9AGAR|nr:P-loop containing nucleoside triphosphate hydrolase protein [Cylindrobasidium torrendii FP15055 ss-10]
MVWEFAGESGAGKTQLGLHVSLGVQLPRQQGGLAGAACYLTTSSKLQTKRLMELRTTCIEFNSPSCSLDNVQTLRCPNIPFLIQVLQTTLPDLVSEKANTSRPVKVVVLDALGELFHTSERTTTKTLVERANSIAEISNAFHSLVSKYSLAVVVLNEVVDTFGFVPSDDTALSYSDQARWFARANTVAGEDRKEAALGLVWANQINARILMSRTHRRRHVEHDHRGRSTEGDTMLIRRLTVVFNSAGVPASVDYVVTRAGVVVIPDESGSQIQTGRRLQVEQQQTRASDVPLSTQIPPMDRYVEEVDESEVAASSSSIGL